MGGRECGQKIKLALFIGKFGIILLPSSNKGKEGKGGYRYREGVSLIDLEDYSELYWESQRDNFRGFVGGGSLH